MMQLSVQAVLLQHQVRERNAIIYNKVQQQNHHAIAKALHTSPNDKLAMMIADAAKRHVKVIKTKDESILKNAAIIMAKFSIRVEKA